MFNATITGRLGTDPEMRYTDGGTPVVNVSIAHNWLYRDERLVKWIRVSIWGELAEKANFKSKVKSVLFHDHDHDRKRKEKNHQSVFI